MSEHLTIDEAREVAVALASSPETAWDYDEGMPLYCEWHYERDYGWSYESQQLFLKVFGGRFNHAGDGTGIWQWFSDNYKEPENDDEE